MTEEQVIEFIDKNARYYNDGAFEPYAVMYEGRWIYGKSPRELVIKLGKISNLKN